MLLVQIAAAAAAAAADGVRGHPLPATVLEGQAAKSISRGSKGNDLIMNISLYISRIYYILYINMYIK
jgi:hypothetical protein